MTSAGRRRPKRRAPRQIAIGLLVLLVFAVGIALGEALHDNPRSGHSVTRERTFTLEPESATVTVTAP